MRAELFTVVLLGSAGLGSCVTETREPAPGGSEPIELDSIVVTCAPLYDPGNEALDSPWKVCMNVEAK